MPIDVEQQLRTSVPTAISSHRRATSPVPRLSGGHPAEGRAVARSLTAGVRSRSTRRPTPSAQDAPADPTAMKRLVSSVTGPRPLELDRKFSMPSSPAATPGQCDSSAKSPGGIHHDN